MAHAAKLQRLSDALRRIGEELRQADDAIAGTATGGRPAPTPRNVDLWPAQVADVYVRLEAVFSQHVGLLGLLDVSPNAALLVASLRGLAGCPDLLGRYMPALVHATSRRLTSLMLQLTENTDPAADGQQQQQPGGKRGTAVSSRLAEGAAVCTATLSALLNFTGAGLMTLLPAKSFMPPELEPARQLVLHDLAGPDQLAALGAAAEALELVLSIPSRANAPADSPLNDAWHDALLSAGAVTRAFLCIGTALHHACEEGPAARPAVRRLAEALQQSNLAEGVCRMLLAPERLLRAGASATPRLQGQVLSEHWGASAFCALEGLSMMAYAACDGPAGPGATAAPVAFRGALVGPAVQRFMRVVPAAALRHAPPADAVPPGRRRELLSLLPSTADAVALLLANGAPTLPADLQMSEVYRGTPERTLPGKVHEAAEFLNGSCGGWLLMQTSPNAPASVRAVCPPAHELLDMLLAQLSLTLRHPKLRPWEGGLLLPSLVLGRAGNVVVAMPRSDVPLYAEAAGKLLHAHFVAALALTDWHDAAPGSPAAAAAAAAAARCSGLEFEVEPTFAAQLTMIQDHAADRALQLTQGADGVLLRALADDLQRRGTGRLMDELLRWHVRNLPWLQAAGALRAFKRCLVATVTTLRVMRMESHDPPRRGGTHPLSSDSRRSGSGRPAAAAAASGAARRRPNPPHARAGGGGGAGQRRQREHGGGQEPAPVPSPQAQGPEPSLSSVRRAARELGSLLSAAKAARVLGPLLCGRGAGVGQQLAGLMRLAEQLMVLLAEGRCALVLARPGGDMELRANERAFLLAAWPVLADASARLACAVLHAHLRGPSCAAHMQAAGSGPHDTAAELLGGPLLSLMGAGQQLFNMAHAAVAAGQPPLEPGEGSTAALLLQALQAPATEALLALAAEFLARQPRATNQEGSEVFQMRLCWLLALLLCMAATPGLHSRVRGWLLPPTAAAAAAAASDGDKDDAAGQLAIVPSGSSSSSSGAGGRLGLPPYDVASLRAERLLAAFERHDGRGRALVGCLRELVSALRGGADGPPVAVVGRLLDHFDINPPAELPAAAPDPRPLLRLCGNPCCTNVDGASEQDLPQLRCAGCGVVAYCSQRCQAQHWRTGGHKQECAAAARQSAGGSSGTTAAGT